MTWQSGPTGATSLVLFHHTNGTVQQAMAPPSVGQSGLVNFVPPMNSMHNLQFLETVAQQQSIVATGRHSAPTLVVTLNPPEEKGEI